jgi:hypothetical protein
MKFKLNDYHRNLSEQELLDDLRLVASRLSAGSMTRDVYDEKGKYSGGTMQKRFGSWNKALEKAGLNIMSFRAFSEKELFENIEEVWIKLGRQPLTKEFKKPLSKYSREPYINKFGTVRKALEAFIEYINSDVDQHQEPEIETSEPTSEGQPIIQHKTKRNPSERLKVQVLMRDGNRCRLCGVTVTGENIHFDHIKPWAKGGETILENLQVLCERHNLAKGDIDYPEIK